VKDRLSVKIDKSDGSPKISKSIMGSGDLIKH